MPIHIDYAPEQTSDGWLWFRPNNPATHPYWMLCYLPPEVFDRLRGGRLLARIPSERGPGGALWIGGAPERRLYPTRDVANTDLAEAILS